MFEIHFLQYILKLGRKLNIPSKDMPKQAAH